MKDTITIPLSVLESLCDDVEIDLNTTQDDLAMKAINSLKSERDELKRQLENINVSSIHSCHDQCKRPMCVLRRERDEAREGLMEALCDCQRLARKIDDIRDVFDHQDEDWTGSITLANAVSKVIRERDEARESLKHITEYGTEEINAAVDLRQKLAAALIERDEAKKDIEDVRVRHNQTILEKDRWRNLAEQKMALRRELESLLNIDSKKPSDEQFNLGINNLKSIINERNDAREELKKLEGAYEDATNYYARMIELREELDQVKEELKNKTYDQLKS